jgi:hypothetical protein
LFVLFVCLFIYLSVCLIWNCLESILVTLFVVGICNFPGTAFVSAYLHMLVAVKRALDLADLSLKCCILEVWDAIVDSFSKTSCDFVC